uniref:TIGR00297 family protein n=1 Tax=Chrysotila carterae TaxID=13221 RepID=A0A7S4FD08_CHRCT
MTKQIVSPPQLLSPLIALTFLQAASGMAMQSILHPHRRDLLRQAVGINGFGLSAAPSLRSLCDSTARRHYELPTTVHFPRQLSSMVHARRAPQPVLSFAAPPSIATAAVQAIVLNSGLAAIGTALGQRVLTPSGLVSAWVLGVTLWSTLGWQGWATCVFYLVCGSAVTKLKMAEKEAKGIAESRGGARGPENVWGSAATAALCAIGTVYMPLATTPLLVGYTASLATKLADTSASEVGKAYGKSTYLITTLKPVPPGTEGAVSLEGLAAGVVGSIVLAAFAIAIGLNHASALVPCIIAAFIANNVESLIGASVQGRIPWMTNEVVNFINTLVGAVVAILICAFF